MSWLSGLLSGTGVERNKASDKDRPSLSIFIEELVRRETAALALNATDKSNNAGTTAASAAAASSSSAAASSNDSSFLAVPLETIGKRVDHNADVAAAFVSYTEERSKNLQRVLKEMRRKSPAIPMARDFSGGTLERCLAELNRIHESECVQLHGRASALEVRVRQPLSLSRDNAVGCGLDYEADLHKYERDTAKAREKVLRAKLHKIRAAERLSHVRSRGFSDHQGGAGLGGGGGGQGLLQGMRRQGNLEVDARADEAEASEALQAAVDGVSDACEQLLVCLRKQDQVAQAAALGFEACDNRLREAISDALKSSVNIELEAAYKRVEDLTKLQASLDTIDGPSDQRTFVDHLKQPELTHCQSAALSLLHDPNNRGALVGVGAGSKSLEPNRQHDNHSSTLRSAAVASTELKGMEQVSPPSLTSESVPEMGLDASLSTDRLRTDMERIVIALFTTTTETSREISSQSTPETSSSTRHDSSSSSGGRASLGLATVAASLGSQLNITGSASTAAPGSIPGDSDSQHPLNPLHPLSPSSSDSSGATQAPPLAPNGPQTSPLSLTTTQQQQPKAASLITANERRRLIAMLDSDAGRQALIHVLNQQRSRRTEISAEGFVDLALGMGAVLDKCRQSKDVHTAKMAMMLSQTFYRDTKAEEPRSAQEDSSMRASMSSSSSRAGREYLKTALLKHPLWEDMSFWDEACWQSISASLKEVDQSGDSTIAWHDYGPAESRDAVLRVHNIVFSQVGAYAHSMVEFGCNHALARQFVRRLAATYQLASDQLEMLLAIVG